MSTIISKANRLIVIWNNINQEVISVLQRVKPCGYVITAKIYCGYGGGISKTRIGMASESSVILRG
ncbi:hypothetical protein [Desulfosediminicola flagellatus]|uniref:hypothetical protein n=1 Tax=Desulfosediminicola flagellatus TaxID=2569541 RepID=UPI0010AD9D5A|nr:hypothetical protein [Desulfosediminicola flagellatus]